MEKSVYSVENAAVSNKPLPEDLNSRIQTFDQLHRRLNMKILVCVKQVPDTETRIKVTGSNLDLTGAKWVMNPYDEFAVEEALKIKTSVGTGEVWVTTIGPKSRVSEVLRTALAMGADEGVVVDGPDFLDAASTARALAEVAKSIGPFDLVLCGKQAIDGSNAAVPQMLAEFLGWPHTTAVSKLELTAKQVRLEREVEGGAKEIVESSLPIVIGANKGLNTPRYASLPGIMKAKKKTLKELDLKGLNVSPSESEKPLDWRLPPERPSAKLLSGVPAEQAKQLVQLLREESKVI